MMIGATWFFSQALWSYVWILWILAQLVQPANDDDAIDYSSGVVFSQKVIFLVHQYILLMIICPTCFHVLSLRKIGEGEIKGQCWPIMPLFVFGDNIFARKKSPSIPNVYRFCRSLHCHHPDFTSLLQILLTMVDNGWQWLTIVGNGWQ